MSAARIGASLRSMRFSDMLSSSDEEAFFDLRSDPYELKNLIGDAALKDEIERHRAMLHEWSVSVGEKRMTVEKAMKTKPSATKTPKPKKKGKGKPKAEAPAK